MSSWHYWQEEPLPSAEDVNKWKHADVIKFLQEKEYFGLNDDDIKIIKNKNFNGPAFLKLTENKLERWGISDGPVIVIADFVKTLNTYVVTKEIHCTASYSRKIANFQWTVTREVVSLKNLKKKLFEYFTFPDGTENEHITISRVSGDLPLTRKISSPRSIKAKSEASTESGTHNNTVERKHIHLSADEDLMSIVWTTSPKVDLTIIVDTSQQPFSSYTFSKMKDLFGLKADSYDQLPQFKGGILMTSEDIRNDAIKEILKLHKESPPVNSANEATRCEFISRIIYGVGSIYNGNVKIYPQYEVSGSHGKGPIDWVIKVGDTIISVTEAKKENINQGVAQSTVQAHASLQRNIKKRNHHEADLYEDVIYCIISTGVDWVITKIVLNSDVNGNGIDNNGDGKVEVFLCSPMPKPLPINDPSLTRDDLVGPVENLFGQIKWVFDQQIESQKRQRTQ